MDKELISIIVPIYNGEKFIKRIYNNIINQSYKPIELILVNDGSTDESQKLIENTVKGHDQKTLVSLRTVNRKNSGIANARNAGLMEASGKYIMFMDQDDWMERDCVEKLAEKAFNSDADIVIAGFNKINDKGEIQETWSLNPQLSWHRLRITAPWGRLFRKAIIDKEKITFLDTKISEDLYFNILFLSYANKAEIISYAGYNWQQDSNSESHKNWSKMSDDRNPLKMLTELHKQMGDSSLLKEDEMTFFFTKYLVWYLLFCSRGATHDQVMERSKEVFLWLKNNYPSFPKYVWKSLKFPKGENFKIRFCVSAVLLMWRMRLLPIFLETYRRM